MQCSSCRAEVPANVAYCPVCGNMISSSGKSSDDPTTVSSPGVPPQVYPSTNYGSSSYEQFQQNPYEQPSPYGTGVPLPPTQLASGNVPLRPAMPSPPMPSPPRNRTKVFLIVGIGALVLILIVVSINLFVVSRGGTNKTTTGTSSDATAMPSYLPYKGILALDDPLQDNSKGYNWQEISDNYGESCSFAKGAYHAVSKRPPGQTGGLLYNCTAESTNFDNFVYQVQMTIVQGDCGALVFRALASNFQFYYFRVCADGQYTLFVYKNGQDIPPALVGPFSSVSVHTGLNQPNLIAIAAKGNTIDLYVNQKKIDSVSDSTYSKGQIAVAAELQATDMTEVIYSNAKVWKLA